MASIVLLRPVMSSHYRPPSGKSFISVLLSLSALSLGIGCSAETATDFEDVNSSEAALVLGGITLKTAVAGRFLGATNNGGGTVVATATVAQAWETFALDDLNGGTLNSGDAVTIRTGGGQYFRALNGGGAALDATATTPQGWENFTIVKATGSGTIKSGDVVAFRAGSGAFISAQNGGGSTVSVQGAALQAWEQFVISGVPSAGDPTCSSGIRNGNACCPAACGACGGSGCGSRPGGTDACCTGPILTANVSCSGAKPPCVVSDSVPPNDGWRLVWSDEFNGTSIDETKWAYEVQRPGWVNNELQNYTNRRAENARIENGQLVLEARRDWYQGYEYSSARIKTQGRFSFTYGKVEARLQVPSGWGTWPAFWMMPNDFSRGWPACGEVDIMEHVGYDPNVVHATTHSLKYNWKGVQQRTSTTSVPGATSGFKTYTAEWYPDRIDFFVDGRKYFTSPNDNTGDDAWPFNKQFYLILNLAVGGDWGGAKGVDPNVWPEQMRVDWVRVYQR